ncbi:MAG TPA: APC family permease [Armatimonadota bacterium]|nr:APC family permease [Armatimonadota bacterium]
MPGTLGGGQWSYLWETVKNRLRLALLGNPLATSVQLEHRLPIYLALPVFASDALSSVAYATEEILIVLASALGVRGGDATGAQFVITLAIVALMLAVGASFWLAIQLYPAGGGSYSVVRDYVGSTPGLVAAASLTIDYILVVAVSTSSAVAYAISSLPWLFPYRVWLAMLLVVVITLINLRGTRESGWFFVIPAYAFITVIGVMILASLYHFFVGGPPPTLEQMGALPSEYTLPRAGHVVGLFVIMQAFSNGCAAMTGVEAVADGTSAFKPPEAKNAAKTLVILIAVLAFLFLGVGFATHIYHPKPSEMETVISQLARANFGPGLMFYLINFATLAVLMVAANTAYAGFPRLAAIVAKDGFMPKSFTRLGDRLVYTTSILTLTVIAALLIWIFDASVTRLIGLYAVGVFLTFTLAQWGVVNRVRRMKEKGWVQAMLMSGAGAVTTGIVTIVIAVSKFTHGAAGVVVAIPIIVFICYLIKRHYDWFDETMTLHPYDYNPLSEPAEPLTVLVLVSSDVHRGILEGLEAGRAIAEGRPDSILRAVHIEMDPEKTPRLKEKWVQFVEPYLGQQIRLDIVPSPYRWLVEPIMDYLDWADMERSGDRVIIVLPEFETGSWITQFLHNFTARRLRAALLNRPHVTVVSSRYFMKPMAWRLGRGGLVY